VLEAQQQSVSDIMRRHDAQATAARARLAAPAAAVRGSDEDAQLAAARVDEGRSPFSLPNPRLHGEYI
jgi:hypothetical protein